MDTCTGAFVSFKQCLQLPEYKRFFGCKTLTSCSKNTLLCLVDLYAKPVLSQGTVIVERDTKV